MDTAGGGGLVSPVVAELELVAPAEDQFLLHGTLPVPPGVVYDADLVVPLQVLDADGSPAPTQVEVVSRYPDSRREGADVVEVLARVKRPAQVSPGERLSYRVRHRPHRPGKFQTMRESRSFLAAPGSLVLTSRDVFGNEYQADLLRDVRQQNPSAVKLKDGHLVKQWATHSLMLPLDASNSPQGTLPHLFGVHAYITHFAESNYFGVDLRIHNGMSGSTDSPLDDALNEIYFDRITLRMPGGWKALHAFDDPFTSGNVAEGGWTMHDLVEPMPNGRMHVMRRQGQLTRRLMVALQGSGNAARARTFLEEKTLAFARPGVGEDGALWSWTNAETARFLPQSQRVPRCDHLNVVNLRDLLRSECEEVESRLASGQAGSEYPLLTGNLGYAQPWGAKYGGMTGGVGINLFAGLETVGLRSRDGYRLAQMRARMHVDRQPYCLYELDGRPTHIELWLQDGNAGPYFPGLFNLTPILPHNDPFGFGEAPEFQTTAVQSQGLEPGYQHELLQYKPIDHQHYVRFTRSLKELAWIGNDALAKSELAMAASVFGMTYHGYPVSPNGAAQAWSLYGHEQQVAEHPGQGLGFGRAPGWGMDVSSAAYALGTYRDRERMRPWFERIVALCMAAQSTCSGYIQATPHHSYDAQWRIRQTYEATIIENGLMGISESVFRNVDSELTDQIDSIIVNQVYGTISPAFWNNQESAPYSTVAVGPYDVSLPSYCSNAEDHHATALDRKYTYTSLAYAYLRTGDEEFLYKAAALAQTTNLFGHLQQQTISDIENRGPLVALVQSLNGLN